MCIAHTDKLLLADLITRDKSYFFTSIFSATSNTSS